MELFNDGPRYLILNLEHIGHFAIISVGPKMISIRDVDELHGNAQAISGAANTALENRADVQRPSDFADVQSLSTKSKRRSARGHAKAFDSVELVDQFFCEAVTEILVFLVSAHICERKHRNRVSGHFQFHCDRCAAGRYFAQRKGHLGHVLKSLAGIFAQTLRNEEIE